MCKCFMESLLRIILQLPFTLLSMFQVWQGKSQATGVEIAGSLCCAQGLFTRARHGFLNRDGLERRVDVVTTVDQTIVETITGTVVTGSSTTSVVSPSNNTSVGVEGSSTLSTVVSSADGAPFIPQCFSATPSAIITSLPISSSTNVAISATFTSLSSIFSPSCIPQTPAPIPSTETLMSSTTSTSATFFPPNSSTSATFFPPNSSTSATFFPPNSSTSATFFPPNSSTATVNTLSTVRPQPSPPFTMSNSDTITLAPVNPTTSIFIGPGTSQSPISSSSISSTPLVIPTFVSSTVLSPISSTSAFLSSIASPSPYPSISAISLSSISDDPTITSTSMTTSDQTVTISSSSSNSSSSETGALSTEISHNASFVHQTGAIVGLTIGGAFFIFIVILSTFFACRRRSSRSNNSSIEDILAASRVNTSWHPPLEADDDERYSARYGRPTLPKYPEPSSSRSERGPFDDLPIGGGRSGSAENAAANGALAEFGVRPPVTQTLLNGSTPSRGPLSFSSHSSYDNHGGDSRPWWGPTEPLNINKRINSQKPSLTVDSHVSAIGKRSASSLGLGASSSSHGHLGFGSSGETLLPRGSSNRSTFIPEPPKPVHKPSERRHYSTPPTAFVEGSSRLGYNNTQRIEEQPPQQEEQEERIQEDRANKSISQVILARIRASRRSSNGSTVNAYSQCTTLESEEEESPSRTSSSHMYSPSLLNPPISMSQTFPHPRGVNTRNGSTFPAQPHLVPFRQDTFRGQLARWPDVGGTLPPPPLPSAPSPVPTDSSSMVEGLLHPRLGMALGSSQQASATSLRDHEDYTRPINGLVNNHLRSTTTFDTQNTVDLNEGGT